MQPIPTKIQTQIMEILNRGNDAVIRKRKDDVVVMEEKRTIKEKFELNKQS